NRSRLGGQNSGARNPLVAAGERGGDQLVALLRFRPLGWAALRSRPPRGDEFGAVRDKQVRREASPQAHSRTGGTQISPSRAEAKRIVTLLIVADRSSRVRLRGIFLQDPVECCAKIRSVGVAEDQRWPQLDNIVMRTVGTGENSLFAKPIHHVGRVVRRRC